MKNHVTSLALSKTLKELGFPQVSRFYWIDKGDGRYSLRNWCFSNSSITTEKGERKTKDYSAYLATELGEWLRKAWKIAFKTGKLKCTPEYESLVDRCNIASSECRDDEQNARAEILIYLTKKGI